MECSRGFFSSVFFFLCCGLSGGRGGPSLKLIRGMGQPRNSASRVRMVSATRCHLHDFLQLSHCTRLPVNTHACKCVRCKFPLTLFHQRFSRNTQQLWVECASTQCDVQGSFSFSHTQTQTINAGKLFVNTT